MDAEKNYQVAEAILEVELQFAICKEAS